MQKSTPKTTLTFNASAFLILRAVNKLKKNAFNFLTLAFLLLLTQSTFSQTNPTAQSLPYTQNFGTTTFTSMPAGMAAWTAGGNKTTQALAEAGTPTADAAITASTASTTTGGVYGFAATSNARAYIQQSSNTTNGTSTIAAAINTGSTTAITVSYQLELINGGVTTQDYGIALQYRAGTTGAFTTISGSALTFGAVTTYTPTTLSYNVTGLTASTVYQIRWITWRPTGTGASKGVGIDNISITAANLPTISAGALTPSGNYTTNVGTASTAKTFSLTGTNLTNNLTVGAVAGYEYSDDGFATAGQSTLTYSTASISKTISVRLTGTTIGTYNGSISLVSAGASGSPASISLTGTVNSLTPTINVGALTPGSSFNTTTGTPSSAQTFTVSATNLTANLTIDAVNGYEFSDDGFTTAGQSSLSYATANVSKTISVRLTGATSGTYNGSTNVTSTGATNSPSTISFTGTVNEPAPVITVGTLSPGGSFSASLGAPSTAQTFTITGTNLTSNLTISAVTGYEYSEDGFATAGQASLSYSTASVSKTISVRLTGASAGTFNGSVSITCTGATNSPSSISLTGSVIITPSISTENILPQYMQGVNGTNANRVPYACLLTINNLTANATYNYFPAVVITADGATSNGAGNIIFASSSGFTRSTGGNLTTAGNFGSFTASATGTYTGWFIIEPTGNATRFIPGNNVYIRINLNDGAGGTTVVSRPTTTSTVKIINLVASAGTNNGTGLRGNSNALAKNFIFTYDNTSGTGRPISGTFVESDGTANSTANSYASFYGTNVEAISGAYGLVIPNSNANGIRRIEQRDFATGNIFGCPSIDADGVWPSGANTVNPTGGSSAIVITSNDALLSDAIAGNVSGSITVCAMTNSGNLTLSGQSGTIIKWQSSTDNFISDIQDISNTTTTQSFSNLTQTTSYRAVIQSGICSSINSGIATITVNPLPTIICPSDITVTADAGTCHASVTFDATATGTPTPSISYSIAPGSTFDVGTTLVTATATNSCGTATCTFTVTVLPSTYSNWLGNISNNWFDASNWCGGVPAAITDVQISAGASNMPFIGNSGAVCHNLTIGTGASLSTDTLGYLTVNGDWDNAGSYNANGGTVSFEGTSLQHITGASTFYNFTLNNTNGLVLNNNVIVNADAQLTQGIITTGTNIFTIANNGGALFASIGYVNGYLKKYVDAGSSIGVNFEVGSATAYTPASFNFNQVNTGAYLTVNTVSTDHPSISSSGFNPSKTINRYWNTTGSGLSFDYYDLTLNYDAADKDAGYIENFGGVKILTGATWNTSDQNMVSINEISVSNATTIGSIQIGVFNPTPAAHSITPDYGYIGETLNVVINGTGFIQGVTSVNSAPGVTINTTTIDNDSTITLNLSISPSAVAGDRKFALSNIPNTPTLGGTTDSLSYTIRTLPDANFFGNRTAITCFSSGDVEFVNYSTNGASYLWDFGAGATPATATGFGPYTVTYSSIGLKTIKLIAFSPIGNDTITRTNYINVTSSAPVSPTSISGPINVCGGGTKNYSVPLVSGITSYNWTLPVGATLVSGAGTRTVSISFLPTFVSGTLSVSQTNGCGTSVVKSVTLTGGITAPTALTGPAIVCSLTTATYTVSAVAGATGYTWTLPAGMTPLTGTSPVTTTGTSLTVNVVGFTSGTLSVVANSSCGSSTAKTLAVKTTLSAPLTLLGTTSGLCPSGIASSTYTCAAVAGATSYLWTSPAGTTITTGQGTTAATISFSASFTSGNITVAAVNDCGNGLVKSLAVKSTLAAPTLTSTFTTGLCPSGVASATYTCGTVAGASSYLWTAPTGATITAGQGTTSATIAFGASFTNGNITVTAVNACGNGLVKSLAVRSTLLAPATLTGTTTGLCPSGVASATYTCATVVGATGYTWTAPTGATITAGQGTTSVTVSFGASFTNGSLSVVATNACGSGVAKTLALRSALLAPATLTGTATGLCPSGVASTTYTCAAVVGATSYLWTAPTGASITAGQGTTSATISFGPTFTYGSITVAAVNACGNGLAKSLAVRSTLLSPGVVTGTTAVCANSTGNAYSILPVVGASSYVWTVPAGATITSGQGTTAITVDFATTAGAMTVKALNACGNGAARTVNLTMTCMDVYDNTDVARTVTTETAVENKFEIYPNPASDNLNINFAASEDKDITIEMFDVQGSRVFVQQYTVFAGDNLINTNVSDLIKGAYFVKIIDLTSNDVKNKTFIKQ